MNDIVDVNPQVMNTIGLLSHTVVLARPISLLLSQVQLRFRMQPTSSEILAQLVLQPRVLRWRKCSLPETWPSIHQSLVK